MSDITPGEAGWQEDPTGKHDHRYWDGSQWTDNVSDAGVASTDPYAAAAATAAGAGAVDPGSTDPTVTEPVAMTPPDPTSTFSAGGPPPPTAPLPAAAAADGSSGGGGSKKGLLIGGGILIVVAIIVAFLAMSGGDDKDDSDALHSKLVSALTADDQGNLSAEDANCVADYLVDNVDHDTLAGLDFTTKAAPDEITNDLAKAADKCNVGSSATTTTESSDDATTTTEGTSDTSGSTGGATDSGIDYSQYKDLIVGQLTAAGLTNDQADCLADRLIDAIQSGDLSEADAFSNFQDYFSDCNIDPSTIGN